MIELDDLVLGETRNIPLEFLDSEDLPVSLFGYSVHLTLKDSPRIPDVEAALNVSHIFPNDAESVAGRGVLTIESDDWSGVQAKAYYWFMYRSNTSETPDFIEFLGSGKINVAKAGLSTFA